MKYTIPENFFSQERLRGDTLPNLYLYQRKMDSPIAEIVHFFPWLGLRGIDLLFPATAHAFESRHVNKTENKNGYNLVGALAVGSAFALDSAINIGIGLAAYHLPDLIPVSQGGEIAVALGLKAVSNILVHSAAQFIRKV